MAQLCAPLPDIMLQNLSDLTFHLSRSLKVKYDSVIGLPIYDFLLLSNSNIWPNAPPLRDISFHNLSGLDIDFSRPLRSNVLCSGINGLPIYTAPLRDIRLRNLCDLDLGLSRSLKGQM